MSIVKSIHGQRYKMINYIAGNFGRLYYIIMLKIHRLAGLAGSRNATLCRCMEFRNLTPPIYACAVRLHELRAETMFEKGVS